MIELYCGDCLEVMPTLPDHCADLILADLPYGTTQCKWDTVIPFEPLWAQYKRIIKPRGAIVLFGSQPFTSALVMSNPTWFKYCWVWEKDKGANFGLVKYRPFDVSEDIAVFSRNGHTYNPQMWDAGFISNKGSRIGERLPEDNVFGPNGLRSTFRNAMDRYPRNIIRAATPKHNDGANGNQHPTQKPVALCEYLIRTYTNEGETVLDNVMGSGTTGVAAVNTGRNGIGIELQADYFAIAERRVRDAQAQLAMPLEMAAS